MYTFIINPHSRSGKGLTIWHTVEAQLEQNIKGKPPHMSGSLPPTEPSVFLWFSAETAL